MVIWVMFSFLLWKVSLKNVSLALLIAFMRRKEFRFLGFVGGLEKLGKLIWESVISFTLASNVSYLLKDVI
jgi:hypothetical protein